MTQLRHDAAYIHTSSKERVGDVTDIQLTPFDQAVWKVLNTAHTVTSVTKTMLQTPGSDASEDRVVASMQRLLQAELIELSPDS